MVLNYLKWGRVLATGLTVALLGCGSAGIALGQSSVAVGVHGVNYTNETFSYIVKDPQNPANSAGGELVSRYSAGGLMCCYSLPRKWHPGLTVRVISTHWLNEKVNGNLPEFKKEFTVEVPKYSEPGELWVLRLSDGTVSVVSSDVSPVHPDWPGKIKGWPVPSAEYVAEKREFARREAEMNLKVMQKELDEITRDPAAYARRMWPKWEDGRRVEYLRFKGPDDPALHNFLLQDNKRYLDYFKKQLEALKGGAE